MPPSSHSIPRYSSPAAGLALRLQFFCSGCLGATWGVQIPTVRDMFALSAMQTSWLMMAMTGGAVAGSLFASKWITLYGPVRCATLGGVLLAALLSSVLLAPNSGTLLVMLLAYGIVNAFYDISINLMASTRETALARPLMSGLHAMFSFGGTIGAASGALAASAGFGAGLHIGAMALLCCALAIMAGRQLRGETPSGITPTPTPESESEARAVNDANAAQPEQSSDRSLPMVLRLMCWVALMALFCESAMYDWTALYIRDHVHASGSIAGIGFGALTAGLMIGRLGGDRVRAWIGDARVFAGGALLAAAGLTLILLWPMPAVVLAGLAVIGLGLANLIPLLYMGAARSAPKQPTRAIARVIRYAMVGRVLDPLLIGLGAEALGLRGALPLVVAVAAVAAVLGYRALRGTAVKHDVA